jgi:flagellin
MTNSIRTNVAAYYSQQNLKTASMKSEISIARLSSGNRIIRAADDVAALSVGTILRTSVSTLKTALGNTQQGNSLLQVADGGLKNVGEILQRMKSLATQATAGTLSASERGFLNQEFTALKDEISRLVDNTKFNQVTLLDGSVSGTGGIKIRTAGTPTNGAFSATPTPVEFLNEGGTVAFVQSDNVTALGATAYPSIPEGVIGAISEAVINNVTLGTSVDVSIKLGSVNFTGTFADGDNTLLLRNGETRVLVTFAATQSIDTDAEVTTFGQLINNTIFAPTTEIVRHYQVDSFVPQGTALAGVTAVPTLRVNDNSDLSIKNFRYTGTAAASQISVDIGGRTFVATPAAATITAGQTMDFINGNEVMRLDLTGLTTSLTAITTDLTSRATFIDGLNEAFTNSQGALTFQTGSAVDDSISVTIARVNTQALGIGSSSIDSVVSAQTAGTALDDAINIVTAVRADVGALQSRMDYAAANIETAIQNQDAARGKFLDADISGESSEFAQAQVLLQASISVLAQANQLPQNLLKLIG